jgi:hypothetical protein
MLGVDLRTNSDYFSATLTDWFLIIGRESVYSAARTGSMYIIQVNFGL